MTEAMSEWEVVRSRMPNIGPRSRQWLAAVGVHTFEDLERLGAVETWRRAKAAFPDRVTVLLLYGLEGALLGLPWNELPPEVKDRLDAAVGRVPRREDHRPRRRGQRGERV